MNTDTEMKIYRPNHSNSKFTYVALAILVIAVVLLGIQNINLKNAALDNSAKGEIEEEIDPTTMPEDLTLTQENPTENWRIYRNLTYNYKFRTPKAYQAKVNNQKNSVEIFNENGQKTIEIAVEPKSDTNTGDESDKKVTVGNINYNVLEFPDGNNVIKSAFTTYKAVNDKYTFSLTFFNSVTLDEMEKLILSTFSEIE